MGSHGASLPVLKTREVGSSAVGDIRGKVGPHCDANEGAVREARVGSSMESVGSSGGKEAERPPRRLRASPEVRLEGSRIGTLSVSPLDD